MSLYIAPIDTRIITCYHKLDKERRNIHMPMTSKEMVKYLKANGFEVVSQNGSHVKLKSTVTNAQTIVPYHSKSLKRGLEQAILKQAGLI